MGPEQIQQGRVYRTLGFHNAGTFKVLLIDEDRQGEWVKLEDCNHPGRIYRQSLRSFAQIAQEEVSPDCLPSPPAPLS